jgi:hypothetical protein
MRSIFMSRNVILTLAFAAVAAVSAVSAAQAQRGTGAPWCLQYKGPGTQGMAAECSYPTLRACRESASGNVGSCMRNPNYRRPR